MIKTPTIGMSMYLQGKLKVTGNSALVMKLGSLFT